MRPPFLPFRPGLVGGHCIGVDPYYLTKKAESVGYNPEIILAGRKLNDQMASYVADRSVSFMKSIGCDIASSSVLIMGLTFKENCPDTRNSKVFDIIRKFTESDIENHVYDPWISSQDVELTKNVSLVDYPSSDFYDCIILAVAHDEFSKLGISKIRSFGKKQSIIYDLKYMFSAEDTDLRL